MKNPLSTLQQLKQELYSLPRERPFGAVGTTMVFGGITTTVLARIPTYLANKIIEPFYTISEIGRYVVYVGAGIWAIGVARRYMERKRLKSR
jgi:hypothetical protein